jgi:hypothetical protein
MFPVQDPSTVEQAAKQSLAIAAPHALMCAAFHEDQNQDEINVHDFTGNLCGRRPSSKRQLC